MDDMTIEQFCDLHGACPEGREWAMENCRSMREVWETANPLWLLWVATRPDVLSDRELRLFAVWCARQVQHLMTDPRSVAAIDVAERYANGEATDADLDAACDAAMAAARNASWDAAWAGGAVGARSAARNAAWVAVRAWDAVRAGGAVGARSAARNAAWVAAEAGYAAWDAAEAAQADWLRTNCTPRFTRAADKEEVTT
jgi:hypothetical protein